MRTALGIILMVAGVAFPMGLVGWLAIRMGRKPAPPPRVIGLVLAFNGVLPVGLVLAGLGMLMPQFWAMAIVRYGAYAALLAAAIILILLTTGTGAGLRRGGRDG